MTDSENESDDQTLDYVVLLEHAKDPPRRILLDPSTDRLEEVVPASYFDVVRIELERVISEQIDMQFMLSARAAEIEHLKTTVKTLTRNAAQEFDLRGRLMKILQRRLKEEMVPEGLDRELLGQTEHPGPHV